MKLTTKKTNFNTVAYELTSKEINTVNCFYEKIGIACERKNNILKEIKNKKARNYRYSKSALRFSKIIGIKSL